MQARSRPPTRRPSTADAALKRPRRSRGRPLDVHASNLNARLADTLPPGPQEIFEFSWVGGRGDGTFDHGGKLTQFPAAVLDADGDRKTDYFASSPAAGSDVCWERRRQHVLKGSRLEKG
jgi:hypothetical protein